MGALIEVVLPVFLVLGFGYVAVWRGYFSDAGTDMLMGFAQKFAIPCLLFQAVSQLDLGATMNPRLLATYYGAALIVFALGFWGARLIFRRDWEDCVAIGFVALFANSVLLGLPITERAFGTEALGPNFAIVAFHAPFAYGIGITLMEMIRARGEPGLKQFGLVLRAMFSNALLVAIALGALVNLSGLHPPEPVSAAIAVMARAGLPAALFALGGVLVRYRPEGDARVILYVATLSLGLHPLLVWLGAGPAGLSQGEIRSAVLTASMPPGVNAFVFATMYGRAQRVAASTVLVATAASVITAWLWLSVLP